MYRRDVLQRVGAIGSATVLAAAPAAGRRTRGTASGGSCYGRDRRRLHQVAPGLVDGKFEITDVSFVPPGELTRPVVDVTFDGRSQVTVVGREFPRPCGDIALDFVTYDPRTREIVVATTLPDTSDQPVACVPEPQVQSYEATVSVRDHTVDSVTVLHECQEIESVDRGDRNA